MKANKLSNEPYYSSRTLLGGARDTSDERELYATKLLTLNLCGMRNICFYLNIMEITFLSVDKN